MNASENVGSVITPRNASDRQTAANAVYCDDCGADEFNCRCDEDDDGFDCTICGGEGEFFGTELPGFDFGWHLPDRVYPCPSCNGTGNRRDQRYM